ncbi:relaxase/mobilization nuclease domain-containing protein [Rugamonas sp. FT29W]|uniref:Relaxase/mobilization nuclease domain-containing protein n=2 Tax=Rugamonas aquatica TaxID=2743357 RepID=A0A6A7N5V8_9BURK|nr:relaxase/mobilization nuclease domain-containing protein [Rugamonas aquatica]
MIAKAVKGRGFRGALDYDLNKEQGRVIDTNMSGTTARELAKELGEVRKLRPKLGKAVLHVSLSAAPGEHLSDEQWQQVAQRYLHGMGLENNQYLVTRHMDTEHEHIHLLVNRVRFDGGVTSDSHDYRRQETLMRAIEREFDLQRVTPSVAAQRHALTKGEIEEGLRTGVPSTRQRLQQLCDGAAAHCHSFSEYAERLAAVGVELVPVTQLEGRKMSGLSYRLDGVMMKGSDLGKGYSPMGLAKRGVSYDKERDGAAVGRCLERGAGGSAEPTNRELASGEADQRGRTGDAVGAARTGDGGVDGRDEGEPGADRAAQPGAGRAIPDAGRDGDHVVAQRDGSGREGSRTTGPGGAADGSESLPDSAVDGNGDRAARERILALAGASADGPEHAGREGGRRTAAARDRSAEAAQRQITAMGVDHFVVTLVDAKQGKQEERRWRKAEVIKSVAWLKRMNARGYDVWIRPDGEHGLVLLGGLKKDDLRTLRERGFAPATVVETGRDEYQAWVKLSQRPLDAPLRGRAAEGLAQGLGRHGAKAISRTDGRLAGFTNQQVQRRREQHPYVLVEECGGRLAPSAATYLTRLQPDDNKALETNRDRQRNRSLGPQR